VLVVAGLLLTAFSLGRVSSTASTSGESPGAVHLRHVVVAPGENLWAIARHAVPGADPRVTVDRIVTLNGLTSATVRPGQRLLLPAG
jgi:LysM repeat protein